MDAQGRQVVLDHAAESRLQYWHSFQPPPSPLRAQLARCAISLALEHHAAIFRLIRAESYGSAAALLRPLLEANTSFFWLMYVADCTYIHRLPTNKHAGRTADIPQLVGTEAIDSVTCPPSPSLAATGRSGAAA